MWRFFPSVPHISKCTAVFQVSRVFPIVSHFPGALHFSRCGTFFQVCYTFLSVAHFSKFSAFLQVLRIFLKSTALFQVWRIFSSVLHFSSGCAIFPSVPYFSKGIAHFFKRAALYQDSSLRSKRSRTKRTKFGPRKGVIRVSREKMGPEQNGGRKGVGKGKEENACRQTPRF